MSDIIVKFKPVGHKSLIQAIKKLESATGRLGVTTGKTSKTSGVFNTRNKRNAKSMSNFGNTLSTARSKLLLWNFAMGAGIKLMFNMQKSWAKLESLRTGFDALTGSGLKSTDMLVKLRIATNGTMNETQLMTQANAAMVLGVTNNSDEMAKMFDMAQRLGSALGVDTKRSIESLITGLGRQSVKMLDNIGIIVKSNEAYEKHALKLKTTVNELTDAEKRQAFFNAALEAGESKVAQLGAETDSSQDVMDQFDTVMTELGDTFMDFAGPEISAGIDKITDFMRIFTETDIEARIRSFTEAGMAVPTSLIEAQTEESLLKQIDDLRDKVQSRLWEDFGPQLFGPNFEKSMFDGINLMKKINKDLGGEFLTFQGFWDTIKEEGWGFSHEEMLKVDFSQITEENVKMFQTMEDKISKLIKASVNEDVIAGLLVLKQNYKDIGDAARRYIATQTDLNAIGKEVNETEDENKTKLVDNTELLDKLDKAYKRTNEAKLAFLKATIDEGLELEFMNELNPEQIAGLDAIIAKYNELSKAIKEKTKGTKDDKKWSELTFNEQLGHVADLAGALGSLVGSTGKNRLQAARLAQSAAIIDTYAGANKAFAEGGTLGFITGAAIIAQGMANVARIETQLSKMGSSSSSSSATGKFEHGGYVGGRPHSQGGTIIEAERGEFVMSRNAVESIGLETLSMMNEGGGGGVNITVTGNVMTQDFVEGELAESIKEAVRRGSDFGIS